ncbi:MAG: LysR substrate-binding domain-containing protein, partial [Alphaproteobacteria bacterium]
QETVLFDEPFLLAHAPDHPLAKVGRPTMGDIEAGTLLLLDEGHCLRNQALSLCGAASVDGRVKSTSLVTLMRLAGSGHGVTLVPALAAGAAGGLTLRPLDWPLARRRVRLVARRQFGRHGALQVTATAARTIAAANGLEMETVA